jgi:hypothetical protein
MSSVDLCTVHGRYYFTSHGCRDCLTYARSLELVDKGPGAANGAEGASSTLAPGPASFFPADTSAADAETTSRIRAHIERQQRERRLFDVMCGPGSAR